jgi:HSP20 family protein
MSFINTLIPSLNGSAAEVETRPVRRPRYEITETTDGYSITVSLPGVSKDGLQVTDEGGELRITGTPAFKLPESGVLYRETSDAAFELVLDHANTIVPEKTVAELQDGVLRVTLSKVESVKPRKIAVT